jgi:hypothetical protein
MHGKKEPLRRSPRKHQTKAPKKRIDKEPPLPTIRWTEGDGELIWALIAQMEVKANRLVLFGMQGDEV